MTKMEEASIFRVTVEGKFGAVNDRVRRYLVEAAPEHTRFQSAYTPEGTFVYDQDINFFSLRYEVRSAAENPSQAAADHALAEATQFLETMDIAYQPLQVDVVDLATMWS